MKNSKKSSKNSSKDILTSNKKTITKKLKEKSKKTKNLLKEIEKVNNIDSFLKSEKKSEHKKLKKNEKHEKILNKTKKVKKNSNPDVKKFKKEVKSIDKVKKIKNELKNLKETKKKPNNKSKETIQEKIKKKNDKKLAALLQLEEMRPRGPRLASLNASCKMHLLYESEREKFQLADSNVNSDTENDGDTTDQDDNENDDFKQEKSKINTDDFLSDDDFDQSPNKKLDKSKKTKFTKFKKKKMLKNDKNLTSKSKNSDLIKKKKNNKLENINEIKKLDIKTKLLSRKNKKTNILVNTKNEKKRKLIDDQIELIDTKSTKRLASLNASAIMAASYQDEKNSPVSTLVKSSFNKNTDSPTDENNYHEKHVEVIQKTKTTTVINNEVTETFEFKKVRQVSGKIRDRLLAIEMMEIENYLDEENNSNQCIIEEVLSDDEKSILQNKDVGKSVLMKKFNSSSNQNKSKHSVVIEEVQNSENKKVYNRLSPTNLNNLSKNDSTQVTSMTTTTKVKINKKRALNDNKTKTVEKYKYEVHNAFHPSFNSNAISHHSEDNLRCISQNKISHDILTKNDQKQNLKGQNATQFISLPQSLTTNPYSLHPGSGYYIYPNQTAAAFQLAYQQQLQQLQSYQNALTHHANLFSPASLTQFSAISPPSISVSEIPKQQSYKSAFSVPNSLATCFSTSKYLNTTNSFTSKMNGYYHFQDPSFIQPINDTSYLIQKPFAFNGTTGNQIYASNSQHQNQSNLNFKNPQKINTYIHPQQPSLIPAMQCFQNTIPGSSYVFQYQGNHGLTQSSQETSSLNSSQSHLANNNTFLNPSSTYPTSNLQNHNLNSPSFLHQFPNNFNQPLNIAFVSGFAGQSAPFFPQINNSTQITPSPINQQQGLFIKSSLMNNLISEVPNLVNTAVANTGLDSTAMKCNLTLHRPNPHQSNKELDKNNTNSICLSSLKNQTSNTKTTNVTKTKSAIIKIKPSLSSSNASFNTSKISSSNQQQLSSNSNKTNLNKSDKLEFSDEIETELKNKKINGNILQTKSFAVVVHNDKEDKKNSNIISVSKAYPSSTQLSSNIEPINVTKINTTGIMNKNNLMDINQKNFLPKPAPEFEPIGLTFKNNDTKNKLFNSKSKIDKNDSNKNDIVNFFKNNSNCQNKTKLKPKTNLKINELSNTSLSNKNSSLIKNNITIKSMTSILNKDSTEILSVDSIEKDCIRTKLNNDYSNKVNDFNSTCDEKNYYSVNTNSLKINEDSVSDKELVIVESNNVSSSTNNLETGKNFYIKKINFKNNLIKINKDFDDVQKLHSHGWRWEGESTKKSIVTNADESNQIKDTYPKMRHTQGDLINVRDCVLLRSGPKDNDVPFVAKISALWEDSSSKAMMMSLLWYYRPEHTDLIIPKNSNLKNSEEIFASKHRDVNSVACIDDKCYVLTLNEYCRYRKKQKMISLNIKKSLTDKIVPNLKVYFRNERLPSHHVSNDMVFCCRKVYDFRQKRILKMNK